MRKPKSFLTVLGALGLLALFPLPLPTHFEIHEAKSELFKTFPAEIGTWIGKDDPVDERTYEILETRNVLSRIYKNPEGEQIHLLLVSSRRDRRVAHPPEVCYLSSNFTITNEDRFDLQNGGETIPVKAFTAKSERNPTDAVRVLYLYKIGDRLTTNYYSQQLQFAVDRLTRQESEIFLIRLAGSHVESLKKFLQQVLPLVTSSSSS